MAKRTALLLLLEETDDTSSPREHVSDDGDCTKLDEVTGIKAALAKCGALIDLGELARRVAK
jgi:hypothetical protein